jgi:hypothetical protein
MGTAPVFQFYEHIFNVVELAVERRAVRGLDFAVGIKRDAGGSFAGGERLE